jgi:hypothetical protein
MIVITTPSTTSVSTMVKARLRIVRVGRVDAKGDEKRRMVRGS